MEKVNIKERAKEIFAAQKDLKRLYVSPDNQFFSSENYAKLHNEKYTVIDRELEEVPQEFTSEISWQDLAEDGAPKVGDLATIFGEPIDGEFQISETEIGLFIDGELAEIRTLKAQ